MKSYIPKQLRQTRERVEIKIERSLLETLERYANLESERDYVVGSVLQVVFRKDKGFRVWLERRSEVETSGDAARPGSRVPS